MTRESLHAISDQMHAIGRDFGVSEIRVFGSVATGRSTSKSDVDLLVRMEPSRTLLDLVGFEQAVADLLQVNVDVVEEGGIHPSLEANIMREARAI